MRAPTKRLASLCLILLPLTVGIAASASPHLRLRDAFAERNAFADRNIPLVRALLKEGIDVNAARADGATALLWAAHWDDREAVELLLRAGANVNAADDHGVTPLAMACENASEPRVNRLLEA